MSKNLASAVFRTRDLSTRAALDSDQTPTRLFPALPVDEGIRFQLNIPPVVDICAPNFISTKELAAIKDEFGAKENKKGGFWNTNSILVCV